MKKNIIYTVLLTIATSTLISCGGGGTPKNDPPSGVELQKPTNNQLCINNTVNFDWTDATDPNNKDIISYKIEFASDRAMTNVILSKTALISNITVTLEKSKAYYWTVTAVDNNQEAGPVSSVFAFFTKGDGVTNAVPFSAQIDAPANGKDDVAAGTVKLRWKGADSDSDTNTLKYDVYFGETSTPAEKATDLTVQNLDVTVEAGKTYYWKINTIDAAGAKSIGQVWSFTVK